MASWTASTGWSPDFQRGQGRAATFRGKRWEIAARFRPDGTTRRSCDWMRRWAAAASSRGGVEVDPPPAQGSRDPPGQNRDPRGPTPFLSGHRCRSRASTRPFFAVVFDHSLRVTAPSVMRNGPAVTSTYSSSVQPGQLPHVQRGLALVAASAGAVEIPENIGNRIALSRPLRQFHHRAELSIRHAWKGLEGIA